MNNHRRNGIELGRVGNIVGRLGVGVVLGVAIAASTACGAPDEPRESSASTQAALSEVEAAKAAYEAAKAVLLEVLQREATVAARATALNIAVENAPTILVKNAALSQLRTLAPELAAAQAARAQAQVAVHNAFFSWRNLTRCGAGAFSVGFAWLSMSGTASAAEIPRQPTAAMCTAIDAEIQITMQQLADLQRRIAAATAACPLRAPDVCAAITAANQRELDDLNARLMAQQVEFATCTMAVAERAIFFQERCTRNGLGATCVAEAEIPAPGPAERDPTCPIAPDGGVMPPPPPSPPPSTTAPPPMYPRP